MIEAEAAQEKFIEFGWVLRKAGLDFDAESMADALWLAQFQPRQTGGASPPPLVVADPANSQQTTEKSKGSGATGAGEGQPQEQPPRLSPGDDDSHAGKLYPSAGTGGKRASAIQVPAASALPGALELARALRPFRRRLPSAYRKELDEEATAESVAQFRFVRPVMRAVAERWFDIALVIDGAQSIDPWRKTIGELEQLLARQGAFGQVRRWRLRVNGGDVTLETAGGGAASVSALCDPRRRTLILIVTDGVASYWNGVAVAKVIEHWSDRAPVAIVQLFSERQWPHTALGPANRLVRSSMPGAPNASLGVEQKRWTRRRAERNQARPAFAPVFSLAPELVARWAQAAMSVGMQYAPAAMFLPKGATEVAHNREEISEPKLTATERVEQFRAFASADAFRLACYLAAVPLTLPVMRIVQQEFLRAPRVEHLAEVIASGLIERVTPPEAALDPDMVVYDFCSGVRDVLMSALRVGTRLEVRAKVEGQLKQFIERQLGRSVDNFRAFVLDESGAFELPASALALVEIERVLLRRLGVRGVKKAEEPGRTTLRGHTNMVSALAFGPDGTLLSGSLDNTVRFWEIGGGEPRVVRSDHQATAVAISADGQFAAFAFAGYPAVLWSMREKRLLRAVGGEERFTKGLAFMQRSKTELLVQASTRLLEMFDVETSQPTLSESLDFGSIASSADGTLLAACDGNNVTVWNQHFELQREFSSHLTPARSVAFAQDKQVLASGSTSEIIIWNLETGKEIRRFPCGFCVAQVAFSADGQFVGSGVENALCVWDWRTGREVFRRDGLMVSSLAFSRGGQRMAAGLHDGSIHVWNVGQLGSADRPFTGIANTIRRLFAVGSIQEPVLSALRESGHQVLEVAEDPDVVIASTHLSDADMSLVRKARREFGIQIVSVDVQDQNSFEELLRRIDEAVLPGRLFDVPEYPEDYWIRPEFGKAKDLILAGTRHVTVEGEPGSGKTVLGIALARDPEIRSRFPGGIFWSPSRYTRAPGAKLLVDLKFEESPEQEDVFLWIHRLHEGVPVKLEDLTTEQQIDFLEGQELPPALHVPAMARLDLLSQWKRILTTFGRPPVEQWLSGKKVPAVYGDDAWSFLARCESELRIDPNWLAKRAEDQGYRKLLEDLYHAALNSPMVEDLYWNLLKEVRSGDEDWRSWFARIIARNLAQKRSNLA